MDNAAAVKPLASNRHSVQHTEDLHKQAAARQECITGSFASNKQHWHNKALEFICVCLLPSSKSVSLKIHIAKAVRRLMSNIEQDVKTACSMA